MSIFKKRSVYITIITLAVIILLSVFAFSSRKSAEEVVSVTRGDIIQEIFITGTVKTDKKVSLSFDRGGSISSLPYSVGSTVAQGALLASLRNETERADIAEVEASVGVAKAKLDGVTRGSRPEEIRVKESSAMQAEVSLINLLEKTQSVITDSYGKVETALHTTIDPLFEGDTGNVPRLTFTANNQSAVYESEGKRQQSENSLRTLKTVTLVSAGGEEGALTVALKQLYAIQSFFLTLGDVLENTNGLSDATLKDYKDRTETARASMATAVTALQNHQNAIRDARVSLEKAKRELDLSKAGATSEDLNEAEQGVLQAEAKLRGANAAFEKTLIRAPFAGRIASKRVEIGETVSGGTAVMELLGTEGFVIEANVPEADITKVAMGDTASVTLDAYDDNVLFTAKVIQIEPAEREIDGVPTYKTTLAFEKGDPLRQSSSEASPRLLSGMTANISIKTTLKTGVMVIPARAITAEGVISYVDRKLADGTTERVTVTTGSRSNSREVEVLTGVNEGDRLVIPEAK